jgi:hypothetical protein
MAPDDSRKTIAELIATLPEEERLILTLHLVNMVSVSEIAEKLGVPGQIPLNWLDFIRVFKGFPTRSHIGDNYTSRPALDDFY